MSELARKVCVPCKGGVPPLKGQSLEELHSKLEPGWRVLDQHHLMKEYRFKDFAAALAFVNRVGALAEEQQHHPDLVLTWGRVRVAIWTHKIDGLTESDFVFAAKTDELV